MSILLGAHIAAGFLALVAGSGAAAARKGGALHARAGTVFALLMLFVGASATILARLQEVPDPGLGGALTCYFVLTSWAAARRRGGTTGKFEAAACAVALCGAGAIIWYALAGGTTPAGPGPLFAFAAVCLLAGLLDLRVILGPRLTLSQRLSRHLWRMCFAFFIAAGSFFIGQQDAMPQAVRGSPLLFALGFAPLAVMLFWLVRLRFAKAIGRWLRPRPPARPVHQTRA